MNIPERKKEQKRGRAVIAIILSALVLSFFVSFFLFRISIIAGDSMAPTLSDNDWVIFTRSEGYSAGDIVVFEKHELTRGTIIKRIVASEGDKLSIENGTVFVNGEKILETEKNENAGSVTIPDGYYYVIGDNYAESIDSRNSEFGLVSEESIKGKVIFRLFPDFNSNI